MNDPENKGDELTPEQIADQGNQDSATIAAPGGGKMSDEDVAAAVAALDGDKNADPEKDEPKKDEKTADPKKEGAKADDDDDKGDDSKGVPTSRFNEAVGKERTRADSAEDEVLRLRQENQQLRDGVDPNTAPERTAEEVITELEDGLDVAREAYEDALDGDDKEARKSARLAVRQAEAALRTESSAQVENRARTGSKQDSSFDNALSQLETVFPEINPDAEEFDGDLSDKLVSLVQGHIRGGMSRVEALEEAAEIYLTPRKKEDTTKVLRDAGKKTNAEAAKTAAPDLSAVGSGRADISPTLKPSRMSERQYADLPDKAKSHLRGDNPVEENAA